MLTMMTGMFSVVMALMNYQELGSATNAAASSAIQQKIIPRPRFTKKILICKAKYKSSITFINFKIITKGF